jgi:hypothetical protein
MSKMARSICQIRVPLTREKPGNDNGRFCENVIRCDDIISRSIQNGNIQANSNLMALNYYAWREEHRRHFDIVISSFFPFLTQ